MHSELFGQVVLCTSNDGPKFIPPLAEGRVIVLRPSSEAFPILYAFLWVSGRGCPFNARIGRYTCSFQACLFSPLGMGAD
jgi:hypothetical protein